MVSFVKRYFKALFAAIFILIAATLYLRDKFKAR
jgi:hypothetical protein